MSDPLEVTTYHVPITKTARVATLGHLSQQTKCIWVACHGYGEIASEFITSMQGIVDAETYVVAPEGLSKFYWGATFDGKPVASWMTREDRLNEIKDYANYLSQVLEGIKTEAPKEVKVILFGFSQGAATVMRWANIKKPNVDAIVVWSGMIPEDISYDPDYYDDLNLYCRYGDQDRFITEERVTQHDELMKEKGLTFQMEPFVGKHKVYPDPLKALAKEIYSKY